MYSVDLPPSLEYFENMNFFAVYAYRGWDDCELKVVLENCLPCILCLKVEGKKMMMFLYLYFAITDHCS